MIVVELLMKNNGYTTMSKLTENIELAHKPQYWTLSCVYSFEKVWSARTTEIMQALGYSKEQVASQVAVVRNDCRRVRDQMAVDLVLTQNEGSLNDHWMRSMRLVCNFMPVLGFYVEVVFTLL